MPGISRIEEAVRTIAVRHERQVADRLLRIVPAGAQVRARIGGTGLGLLRVRECRGTQHGDGADGDLPQQE